MKFVRKAALAALSLSCATMVLAPQANSATLLDFLRGNKTTKTAKGNNYLFPPDPAMNFDPEGDSTPLPKVSSPKYFTYKPEALRLIAVSKFSAPSDAAVSDMSATDPETTGSVQLVSTAPSADVQSNPRAYMIDVKVKANSGVAGAVEQYYTSHEGLIWVDANGISDKARAAMAVLAGVAAVGLDPADYAVIDPSDTFSGVDEITRQRQLMLFEIELSAAALSFIEDTKRGRIDPNRISEYHDFKRNTVNLDAAIVNMALSTNVGAYLESRNPSNPEFAALKAELAAVTGAAADDKPRVQINLAGLLRPGQNNSEVANVVEAIRQHGSDKLKVDHSLTLATYDGGPAYAPEVVALVKAFQSENGLKPDGIVGQGTIRVLLGGDNSADKANKLIVAMEQRRWLPDDLGARFVFVNQPAFTAYYHNNNQEEFNMGVVVGSPGHQTFFFRDEIETVEFNPYWGVPRSIIVNEMLPKLREDPSYLDRLGYETSVGGRRISSTSVDWYTSSSVDVRQPPGGGNALGQLKILFPNAHAIYMHDTPQKSFFKRDMRALSHGCIRLSDPKKMAAAVMNTTVEDITAQIAVGQNHSVPVPQRFPVYVSYFTAWPNKDGVVEYFNDVYKRDTYVNKAFVATSKVRHADS